MISSKVTLQSRAAKYTLPLLSGVLISIGGLMLVPVRFAEKDITKSVDNTSGLATAIMSTTVQATVAPNTPSAIMGPKDSGDTSVQVIIMHPQYAFKPSDTKQLVKNTDSIFIGKVVKQTGEKQIGGFSYPVFSVQVIESVKGDAFGTVDVVQADVRYRDKKVYVSEGDISISGEMNLDKILLKQGSAYIFTALYVKDDHQYGISIAPYDRTLITNISTSSESQIKTEAGRNPRIKELRSVVKHLGVGDKVQL